MGLSYNKIRSRGKPIVNNVGIDQWRQWSHVYNKRMHYFFLQRGIGYII